jgi:hypothetical protein
MKTCKRIVAGLTLLLCAAGLLLSLVVGGGVWIIKRPVTERVTHVFERVEAALDVADEGLDHVKTSLARAAERLESAKEEQRKLAQEPQQNSALRRMVARTVQQRIAPEFGNANEELHTVAEAAVVVNSVLEDVGNFPFLSVAGLDLNRLTEVNSRLAEVGPAAWELSRLLVEPGQETDAARTQLSRIEQALNTMRGFIAEYVVRVGEVRQQVDVLRSRTLPWITPAAVLVSLACFWIALSQVSLMAHAWRWSGSWKRENPRAGTPVL